MGHSGRDRDPGWLRARLHRHTGPDSATRRARGARRRACSDLPAESVRVSNQELATVREAMRELHRLLAALAHGEVEKVVLTQKNQMRAVLLTLERYSELERQAGAGSADVKVA